MPDLIRFEWEKCPDGYSVEIFRPEYLRFEEIKKEKERQVGKVASVSENAPDWFQDFIVHNQWFTSTLENIDEMELLVPNSNQRTKFRPLEESPAVFMEFAGCANSVSNVLRFANLYGLLQDPLELNYGPPVGLMFLSDREPYQILEIESIQGEAEGFQGLIDDWETAKKNGHYELLETMFNYSWGADTKEELDGLYKHGSGYGEPPLVNLAVCLQPARDHQSPPILSLVPKNFEAALYLQFAIAISDNAKLQRCAVCPAWFSYRTGTGRRKSAHYCSDRCRKVAWLASQNKSKN